MPPRIAQQLVNSASQLLIRQDTFICWRCQYATVASTTLSPSQAQVTTAPHSMARYMPDQPPSHRPPAFRRSQLLRSYVSLLQCAPMIVLFQHNNLRAMEWIGVRRELAAALKKVDDSLIASGRAESAICASSKLQVLRSRIFEPALRISELWHPDSASQDTPASITSEKEDPTFTHVLSEAAYQAVLGQKGTHPLAPLLAGPVAALSFPIVSPQHLKAALRILSPSPPSFPAPTRKANPGYHSPVVQEGLRKLLLLGAMVEGKVFDLDGTRWVGGIEGGLDGLRTQLVYILQGCGVNLTNVLVGAGRSLYFAVERRRQALEEESKLSEGALRGKEV